MQSDPIIVILEDELPQVLILRAALECIGEIKDFDDPTAALGFLRDHRADVAIVDVHLPRVAMNGIEFLRAVREFDEDLCVIVRTGDDSTDLADSAIAIQAFRRAIKTKVTVAELREMIKAAITTTRARRQVTLAAANTSRMKEQLTQTLGTIDEELSVTDSCRGLFQAMRSRLTAIAGTAEILSEIANRTRDGLLHEHSARNKSLVAALLGEVKSFVEGPYAESLKARRDEAKATANGILKALEKRFVNSPEWFSESRSLSVVGLADDLYLSVGALRLITAIRHLIEFCSSRCPSGTVMRLTARCVHRVSDEIRAVHGDKLVFNRRFSNSQPLSVAFRVSCPLAGTSLEDIRSAFHAYPENPRVGNLHMIGFTLGAEQTVLVVHRSVSPATVFELFVPVERR